jgi:HD superfamily phosphodiesterase
MNFDYTTFKLSNNYFDHPSTIHGINHTYRVMYHVLNIGRMAGLNHEIHLAFCAAFIHDMSRMHDGYCTEHGGWAARNKLPEFKGLFLDSGVSRFGIRAIKLAVANHSVRFEIRKENPYYKTVALLKDADALDRIRIGGNNLKVEYLRYPETIKLIDFAKTLYYQSEPKELESFDELIEIAEKIGPPAL